MEYFDNNTETFKNEEEKKRLILRLTDKQAEMLKNGTIGLTGLGLGAAGTGIYFLFGSNTSAKNEEDSITGTSNNEEDAYFTVETELPVALVSNELSFKDAFVEARQEVGAGGFFEWRGNTYNTYYKEEWNGMSDQEKEDYLSAVEKATDITSPEKYVSGRESEFGKSIENTPEENFDTPEVQVAEVNDSLSFKDAFAEARQEVGAGGIFEWRGKAYNTYNEEEWRAMSDIQKEEFLAEVKIAAKNHDIELIESERIIVATGGPDDSNEDIPELEPLVGISDLNSDGIIDAVAIDINRDGYADVFAVDVNEDGYADGIAWDNTGDENLDVLIIDEGQDGFDDHIYAEKTDGIVSMDEFIILDEEEQDFADDNADIDDDHTDYISLDDIEFDNFEGPEL